MLLLICENYFVIIQDCKMHSSSSAMLSPLLDEGLGMCVQQRSISCFAVPICCTPGTVKFIYLLLCPPQLLLHAATIHVGLHVVTAIPICYLILAANVACPLPCPCFCCFQDLLSFCLLPNPFVCLPVFHDVLWCLYSFFSSY